MNKHKGIAFFLYSYPPIKGMGTIRNDAVSGILASKFKASRVYSSSNRFFLKDDSIKPSHTAATQSVKFIPTFDYKTIKHFFFKKSNKSASHKSSTGKKATLALLDHFPLNIIIGQGGLLYYLYALISFFFIRKKVSHIYCSFRPFTDIFIGYTLKLLFPKKILITDIRDLYISNENKDRFLFKSFHQWLERSVLNKSDIITTVSNGLKYYLEQKTDTNILVVRNSIFNSQINTAPPEVSEKFTITYMGTLYSGLSDPKLFFAALSDLIKAGKIERSDISLIYAGNSSHIWNACVDTFGLEDINQNLGMIPREHSIQLQRSSCLNLLLTWASPESKGILTGKLFEYLSARRPILSLINGSEEQELSTILSQCQYHVPICSDDENYLAQTKALILNEYTLWQRNGTARVVSNLEELQAFTWEENTAPLLQALNLSQARQHV